MKTKIFSLVLIVVLLCTLFGCSSSRSDLEPSIEEEISTVTAEIETTSPPAETATTQVSTTQPQTTTKGKKTNSTKSASSAPKTAHSNYQYTDNLDINDNVFMDALVYTGYNIEKHRSDGLMWVYVLASRKRAKGWLSNLGFSGISSGYETTADGKPNIKQMENNGGLVCASFVTYVYFNYLPNVAGIDTSYLPKPVKSNMANDWYIAAKKWIDAGYSKRIGFTATKDSANFIHFKPNETIPIGSILVFCDALNRSDRGHHVCIYAGYKNNNHWVYHVGNKNGPEFCAVERMHFGPDPQWPIAVITPPNNLRFAACLNLTLRDDNGNPISGVSFQATNKKSGTQYTLGTTNSSGNITKEGLPFGEYTLTQSIPNGYIVDHPSTALTLTTKNNSLNKIALTNHKNVPSTTASIQTTGTDSLTIAVTDNASNTYASQTNETKVSDTAQP